MNSSTHVNPRGLVPFTYGYDLAGSRLTKAVAAGATTKTTSYIYDYRARRVVRDETGADGVLARGVFSGDLGVQEYDGGSTTATVEFLRGSDYGGGMGGILYSIRGGTPSYTYENRSGDVVAKTDDSGVLTSQAAYEAYGTRTQENNSTPDRQKANTKDEDPTGLLNEGFRYRDLETGSFITKDPLGFVDGPNVYTYVNQNPWTSFDPEGLFIAWMAEKMGEKFGSNPVVAWMAPKADVVVNSTQGTLMAASAVPALGKVADVLSATISAAGGDYSDAGLMLAGGVYGKAEAKLNDGMNIVEGGADVARIIKEGGEQIKKKGDAIVTTARNTVEEGSKKVDEVADAAKKPPAGRQKGEGMTDAHATTDQLDGITKAQDASKKNRPSIKDNDEWEGVKQRLKTNDIQSTRKSEQRAKNKDYDAHADE